MESLIDLRLKVESGGGRQRDPQRGSHDELHPLSSPVCKENKKQLANCSEISAAQQREKPHSQI